LDFRLSEEQQAMRAVVREVAERELKPRALEWEKSGEFPWVNMKLLAELGVLGLSIPERYGGAGGSWLDAAIALEEIGRCCYVTAMAVLGEVGVQSQAIVNFGSDMQKQKYLPAIARGDLMCAICITEPDFGSDAGSMTTRADEEGDAFVVNGTKELISRGDVAGLFLLYTRFGEVAGSRGVGALLVERDTPGFSVGRGEDTLGGERLFELRFENARVPRENLLVREDGFRKLMGAFNGQRCLNSAICIGIAQGALDEAIAYVQGRQQFGQPIGDFQGIRWVLADMALDVEAARLLVWRAAAGAKDGLPDSYEAGLAKLQANEMALRVTDKAMQLFGGHGYLKSMPPERYLRWARYGGLGGGTPHIQRNLIAARLVGGRGRGTARRPESVTAAR
jgi:alkylation response protein AidB-like acyl-CoA dehydrogenase